MLEDSPGGGSRPGVGGDASGDSAGTSAIEFNYFGFNNGFDFAISRVLARASQVGGAQLGVLPVLREPDFSDLVAHHTLLV
jgi:hypothetical protein